MGSLNVPELLPVGVQVGLLPKLGADSSVPPLLQVMVTLPPEL